MHTRIIADLSCTLDTISKHCVELMELTVTNTVIDKQALFTVFQCCKNLTKLILVNGGLDGQLALQHCPNLEELDLTNNGLTEHDATTLAAELRSCKSITICCGNEFRITQASKIFSITSATSIT